MFWRILVKNPFLIFFLHKAVFMKVINWWKFGFDNSNHFWDIKNLAYFLFISIPHVVRFDNMKDRKKNQAKFWISQRWFEISKQNFHLLLTSMVQKIKALVASKNGFPTKKLQNFKWAWQTQFFRHRPVILKNCIYFEDKLMILLSFFVPSMVKIF